MTIVWCGVPSGGSQGHSSWWPSHLLLFWYHPAPLFNSGLGCSGSN